MEYGLVVAGGSGTRIGMKKQYIKLAGKPMWQRSVDALIQGGIEQVWVVVPPGDVENVQSKLDQYFGVAEVVAGGRTRGESVRNGVNAIFNRHKDDTELIVAIHDAARPFVSPKDVASVIVQAKRSEAAILAERVVDTVKRVGNGIIQETIPRDELWRAQTPQAFSKRILDVIYDGKADLVAATDEASMLEAQNIPVTIVEATDFNGKVTTQDDLLYAYMRAEKRWGKQMNRIRVGSGFDVHRFIEGRPLYLGGVKIPYELGLDGHSDADVVLHAVMDACLGALALGDIGLHFPNTSPEYKNADSKELARHVYRLVCEKGYRLGNMDVMIMAEAPKIGPHTLQMQEAIAEIFECDPTQVSIKATTMENLGFVGRREGITAQATVLLEYTRDAE